MRLYLDSADLAVWEELLPTGIFHGVTTNPLWAARAGLRYRQIDWRQMATHARRLGARELHVQVYGAPETYCAFAERVFAAGAESGITTVVKIPLTEAGIRATPGVMALGGPVLMTACYHAKQMIVARNLGAAYIAPYAGRMADAGLDALAHLRRMAVLGAGAPHGPTILAASIRSVDHLLDIADCGVGAATIPADIARDLLNDPLTDAAVTAFEATIELPQ